MIDTIKARPEGSHLQLLAPIARGRKGEYLKTFADLKAQGYVRVRVDGETRDLGEEIKLNKQQKHDIELVVDRIILKDGRDKRLADSLELCLQMGNGLVVVLVEHPDGKSEQLIFSQELACVKCGISIEELSPRAFSFNNPFGACPACGGLGFKQYIDENLMIANENLSINQGALLTINVTNRGWFYRQLEAVAKARNFSLDIPFKDLSATMRQEIFYGCGNQRFAVRYTDEQGFERVWQHHWEGLVNNYQRRYAETNSDGMRDEFERYMTVKPCEVCNGARLKKESLAVTVGGFNIYQLSLLPIAESARFFDQLKLNEREQMIAVRILKRG